MSRIWDGAPAFGRGPLFGPQHCVHFAQCALHTCWLVHNTVHTFSLVHSVDATLPSTPNFILCSSTWNAAHCVYHLHQPLYFWRITFLLAPVLINRFWGCSAFLVCAMTTHAIVPKSDCFVDQTFQNLPEHLHLCWNFQHFLKACLGMPVLARSKSVLKVNTFPWRGRRSYSGPTCTLLWPKAGKTQVFKIWGRPGISLHFPHHVPSLIGIRVQVRLPPPPPQISG